MQYSPLKGLSHMNTWVTAVMIAVLLAGSLVLARRLRVKTEPPEPAVKSEPELGAIGGTLPDVLVDPCIVVKKASRTLSLHSSDRVAKTYRIALGADPIGNKEREGDGRTPEGQFYICTKNPESDNHRALGVSYPSYDDADRGLAGQLITKREYNRILDALGHLRQPPWNTALGGEIMIHGHGTHADWTQGCVALSDEDAEELFDAVPLGTTVRIEP